MNKVCPIACACRMDVLQEAGQDAGGRQLPAVLILFGEVEQIRELAINSPYPGIVPEVMGQRNPMASALRQICSRRIA